MKKLSCLLLMITWYLGSYAAVPKRIITLSAALSETTDALGLGKNIVAVDVTTTYPVFLTKLPKVSNNRSVSAEALIAFAPDLVLAPEGSVSKEIQYQLKSAGIRFVSIKQEYSVNGALKFIRQVAEALQLAPKGELLARQTELKIKQALAGIKSGSKPAKVLFIYARGTGVMMVAGKKSSLDAVISLSGGKNAINEFEDFKPYTTEALVKANPDVILMFDFGLTSLGGVNGILKMPGVAQTSAGKNKRIVQMDPALLTNFSVRLDQAITALNGKLMEL
ncbi:iron complex transport system substrate-binding protein [Pedobacter cryoconitis]|uniref:Iron complex transport system substrate-binding protein n=1 Tax=Pedobacter cryoconitis TaxID=188932 RepID=A0A7W8ZKM7_9SPHI|nr:ABC transporter substrate-binding protein [Pedobacter cryoconitis]MBB5635787.1 iron complex transport system substrate-binding protein [Pedobacter cryoconitis]